MGRPQKLHDLLLTIVDNVYFQPPATLMMQYPCIRYRLDDEVTSHADNRPYHRAKGYQLTVISKEPLSDIREKVADLPGCRFDRFYPADNLNHDVFTIFF